LEQGVSVSPRSTFVRLFAGISRHYTGTMENEVAISDEAASATPAAGTGASPAAQKPNAFLTVFLLLTIVGLVAIDIYQDRVIQKQRYELRWLITHSIIRPDTIAADDQPQQPAAQPGGAPPSSANVAPAPVPPKAPQSAPQAAKP